MKKEILFLIISLSSLTVLSQSTRFISLIDSTYSPVNSYIEEHKVDSYFTSGLGDRPIDYFNLDSVLLNAAVFFHLNRARTLRNRQPLEYDSNLDFLAYNCTHIYSKSKFRQSKKNDIMFEKNLYLAARSMPMNCHLFTANTSLTSIMDIEPKRKIHRAENDTRSTYRLYYKNPPELKDELEDIVYPLTYNEFAENVIKDIYSRKTTRRLNSKSYETMGCYVYIVPKSMNSNKPPYAKVIQIIGARRLVVVR